MELDEDEMTDDNLALPLRQQAAQPTTYYQPQYEPAVPNVRGMPSPVRGGRGALQADSLLDLGALASAAGMTRAQVTGFLHDCQEASLNAVLTAAPKLLRHNREVTQARINEISMRVERLRRVNLAQQRAGIAGWLGMAPNQALQVNPEYVALAEVQMILAEVMAALVSQGD